MQKIQKGLIKLSLLVCLGPETCGPEPEVVERRDWSSDSAINMSVNARNIALLMWLRDEV